MTRQNRTEILTSCNLDTLKIISKVIVRTYTVDMLEEPNSGLVMVKMRESAKKNLFYLGEVFVTECKVMIGNTIGLGIIRGSHPKKAYHLAVIDAAYNANLEEINLLDEMIEEVGVIIDEAKKRNIANLFRTKVDFVTLDEEVKA